MRLGGLLRCVSEIDITRSVAEGWVSLSHRNGDITVCRILWLNTCHVKLDLTILEAQLLL